MKIAKDKYYGIFRKELDGTITWFNKRLYLGKYVLLAYNQIPNKELYRIAFISYNPVVERANGI